MQVVKCKKCNREMNQSWCNGLDGKRFIYYTCKCGKSHTEVINKKNKSGENKKMEKIINDEVVKVIGDFRISKAYKPIAKGVVLDTTHLFLGDLKKKYPSTQHIQGFKIINHKTNTFCTNAKSFYKTIEEAERDINSWVIQQKDIRAEKKYSINDFLEKLKNHCDKHNLNFEELERELIKVELEELYGVDNVDFVLKSHGKFTVSFLDKPDTTELEATDRACYVFKLLDMLEITNAISLRDTARLINMQSKGISILEYNNRLYLVGKESNTLDKQSLTEELQTTTDYVNTIMNVFKKFGHVLVWDKMSFEDFDMLLNAFDSSVFNSGYQFEKKVEEMVNNYYSLSHESVVSLEDIVKNHIYQITHPNFGDIDCGSERIVNAVVNITMAAFKLSLEESKITEKERRYFCNSDLVEKAIIKTNEQMISHMSSLED